MCKVFLRPVPVVSVSTLSIPLPYQPLLSPSLLFIVMENARNVRIFLWNYYLVHRLLGSPHLKPLKGLQAPNWTSCSSLFCTRTDCHVESLSYLFYLQVDCTLSPVGHYTPLPELRNPDSKVCWCLLEANRFNLTQITEKVSIVSQVPVNYLHSAKRWLIFKSQIFLKTLFKQLMLP